MQIVVNGTLTHYESVNPRASKVLVILHEWGADISFWIPFVREATRDCCYILVDLPGFGHTQNLTDYSNVPDYADFVYGFINKLQLRKFSLLGHSFGGQIAVDFAIKYPEKIKKLILIAPAAIRTRKLVTKIKITLAKVFKPLRILLPTQLFRSVLPLISQDYSDANRHQRSVLSKILKYDLGHKLHLIKVPTEIIWGSEDKIVRPIGKLFVNRISNSRLHIIYGADHMPHWSHRAKLVSIINTILDEESA